MRYAAICMSPLFFTAIAIFLTVTGCGGDLAEKRDQESVRSQQNQYRVAQPVPKFDFSLERDVASQLYEARNNSVRTWTVWRSDYGLIEGHCDSIGYPIPYDVQLTNPLKPAGDYGESRGAVIEQAEPNGLYSSHNSNATWVRSVVKKGDKSVEVPIYIESKVTCYPYPITVDYEKNRVIPTANAEPTVIIKKRAN